MNPVSIIILVLILGYCIFILYKQREKKKNGGGCGGNCTGCAGCGSQFHDLKGQEGHRR